MKKNLSKVLLFALALVFGASLNLTRPVNAEEADETTEAQTTEAADDSAKVGTSISLTPVSKVLQISSESEYKDTFKVTNEGNEVMEIEVYSAPYSYVYSETEDAYKLGFSNENSFTQIARWITFKDNDGNYVKNPQFTIEPNGSLEIKYKISTPSNIPAGGQYAVIFAHTLTGVISANGIKTEASPGLVVYGRSTEGEAIMSAEISDIGLKQEITENGATRGNFYGSAKVKNTGNVDFSASGVLKVEPILFGPSYETPANEGRISVIPEAELVVSDEWEETPQFGIYKVTWTVIAADQTETIEQIIFVNPVPVIIVTILLLTIIIVWIIIRLKKRKERRSRLAV